MLSTIALFFIACSEPEQQTVQDPPVLEQTAPINEPTPVIEKTQVQADTNQKPRLLFFLNPNGRPCIMQDQILKEMTTELYAKAEVEYISTSDPKSRKIMMEYGIRALPTILIADAAGNILHQFPPGIQSKEALLAELD